MVAVQEAKNHGDEWELTWYLRWGKYISTSTWTNPQNSLATAEAIGLKISSHATFIKWSRRSSQPSQK